MMDKKRKTLNNQQLTDAVVHHEIRITKLEAKKKKIIKKCGKGPKVTIADVMQTLLQFQNSVDQRLNKVEKRLDKIENRIDKLETSVEFLNNQVQILNKAVFKKNN